MNRSLFAVVALASLVSSGCGGPASADLAMTALGEDVDRLASEAEQHATEIAGATDVATILQMEKDHQPRVESMMDSMMQVMNGLSSCTHESGQSLDTMGMHGSTQKMLDECELHQQAMGKAADMAGARMEEDRHQKAMSSAIAAMRENYGMMQGHAGMVECSHCAMCGGM